MTTYNRQGIIKQEFKHCLQMIFKSLCYWTQEDVPYTYYNCVHYYTVVNVCFMLYETSGFYYLSSILLLAQHIYHQCMCDVKLYGHSLFYKALPFFLLLVPCFYIRLTWIIKIITIRLYHSLSSVVSQSKYRLHEHRTNDDG